MKKITLLLLACMAFAGTTLADDYNYVTIQKTDGTEQSFAANGLVLTFQGANMTARENGKSTTFSLADLNKMFFSDTATGITDVTKRADNNDGLVKVYTLSGAAVGTFTSADRALSTLKKGVYVVRQNGEAKKVAVK